MDQSFVAPGMQSQIPNHGGDAQMINIKPITNNEPMKGCLSGEVMTELD